jgi:(p)ppGpp synthase/HD superfamily hydrolase
VQIAQTNIQLYNQLRAAGRPPGELVTVHRAYELLAKLYPGYYQADGKPFVAHGVGVASILAWLDQPADIVAVGLLHNVYGNADFGDGRAPGVTPARARLVRAAVGETVERLLERFRGVRIRADTLERVRGSLPELDETDRRLILVELADHLEKYADLGVLYFGDHDWVQTERIGPDLVALANELGEPRLAEMLTRALDEAAAADVPPELRPSDGRSFLKLEVPRSCRRRLLPRVRRRARRALHR